MASDTIATVFYDGQTLVSLQADGGHVIHRDGVNRSRIDGSLIDVSNVAGERLSDLQQKADLGLVNPFLEAVLNGAAVYTELPIKEQRAVSKKQVSAVLDAVVRVAKRHIQ